MNKKALNLWQLFSAFFRIGLFTIGGGYAMLPMLHREVVEKYKWVTDEEIMDYYAIGQSTPGIIGINTATFVGIKQVGVVGGIFATLGMVTPSWIIITLIAKFLQEFKGNSYVQEAFMGIRIMVVILIVQAVMKMFKKSVVHRSDQVLFILAFIAIAFVGLSPILILVVAGIYGAMLGRRNLKGGAKDDVS